MRELLHPWFVSSTLFKWKLKESITSTVKLWLVLEERTYSIKVTILSSYSIWNQHKIFYNKGLGKFFVTESAWFLSRTSLFVPSVPQPSIHSFLQWLSNVFHSSRKPPPVPQDDWGQGFLLLTNRDVTLTQQQLIRKGQDTNLLTFTLWRLYYYKQIAEAGNNCR